MRKQNENFSVKIYLMRYSLLQGWLPINCASMLNMEIIKQMRPEEKEPFNDYHWETPQFNLTIKSQPLPSERYRAKEFGVVIEFQANEDIRDDVKKGEKLRMEVRRASKGSVITLTSDEFRIFKGLWKDIFKSLFEGLRILAESSDEELDLMAKMLIAGIEDKEIMRNTLKVISSSKKIGPGFIFLSKDPDEKNKQIDINAIISYLQWDYPIIMISLNNGSTYVTASPDYPLSMKEILAGAGIKNFCNKGAFFNSGDQGAAIAAIGQSIEKVI